jgi:hypothetical protein
MDEVEKKTRIKKKIGLVSGLNVGARRLEDLRAWEILHASYTMQ